MKYATYNEYKPSGITWLGNVPSHWTVARSDGIVSSERRQVQPEAFLSEDVFHYSIPLVQEYGTGAVEEGESIKSAKQPVYRKSLLVSKLNPRKATIVVAEPQANLRTVCSTEFVTLFADKCDLRFLTYVTLSEAFRQRLDAAVQSVTRSHQRANPQDIYSFWNAWPPVDEQQTIARFLDAKTAQIDALVAQKLQLIAKLKEKRQALIARTVTRGLPPEAAKAAGLEPNPEMKDSGVDWLGEIPAHWTAKAVRYIFRNCDSHRIPLSSEERADLEKLYPYYGASGVIDMVDNYLFDEPLVLVAEDGANLLSRSTPLAFLATGKYWVNNHAHILKPHSGDIRYWVATLETFDFSPLITGAAQPKLTADRLGGIRLPVPPATEQVIIADYLATKTGELDALIGRAVDVVDRLTEYRQALITSAVTGKIDVRGVA